MNGRDFLADRLTYIAAVALALTLALVVAGLAIVTGDRPLSAANLAYSGLLALAAVGGWLVVDYLRQRPFRRQVAALLGETTPEAFATLGAPATREQAVLRDLLALQHRLDRAALTAYQRQQELNVVFSTRWAHQMKTPVAVLDATLQEAERGGQCPPELLTSLREETDKLAAGLDLMLSSARLSDFRSDFVVHQTDLAALARRAVNEHRLAFIRQRVFPVLVAPEGATLSAETDEKWLRFVIGQLLTNAIKYSRPAGATVADAPRQVTVTVAIGPEGATISVADQGIGIAAQDLDRVFDPFFTGENGRLYPEATGMGLYLARTVCERLGHRIAITSQPGSGTTVTVTISYDRTLRGVM